MKYINREYGFAGRPPYFNDFFEESSRGPQINDKCYPNKIIAGAGLDYKYPNGMAIIGEHGTMWGIRVSYLKNGKWLDGEDFLRDRGKLYVSRGDGKFSYFSHGDITVSVVSMEDNAVAMSVSTVSSTKVRIIYYSWDPCGGVFKASASNIKGIAPYHAVIKGETNIDDVKLTIKGRYDVIESDKNKEYFFATSYHELKTLTPGKDNEVVYEYELDRKEGTRVYVYATVGGEELMTLEPPTQEKVTQTISDAEINYSNISVAGSGTMCEDIDYAASSVMWNRIYNPYFIDTCFMNNRSNINRHYAFDGFDYNIANLTGALYGDYESASHGLKYAVGDELASLFVAWIIYQRSGNKDMWTDLYPVYKEKILAESEPVIAKGGSKYKVAYRMPLSPLKESHVIEDMYSLDMCCIKVLNLSIMQRVALLMGEEDISKQYSVAKLTLTDFINNNLYNKDLGVYMNKYVSGNFASNIGITSFLPLIAGVVDSGEKLRYIRNYLESNRKFGGDFPVPTISRDNPEYGKKYRDELTGDFTQKYEGYRGMVVPYMNYYVYMGLIRYGLSDTACTIANKSAKIFRQYRIRGRYLNLPYYLPNGKIHSMGEEGNVSANLMLALGMCALIDCEYFRDDLLPAIKFGTTYKGEHSISNVLIRGDRYSVNVTERYTSLVMNNIEVFKAEGGKCEVRNCLGFSDNTEMMLESTDTLAIHLKLTNSISQEKTNVTFAVAKGYSLIKIVDGKVNVTALDFDKV